MRKVFLMQMHKSAHLRSIKRAIHRRRRDNLPDLALRGISMNNRA